MVSYFVVQSFSICGFSLSICGGIKQKVEKQSSKILSVAYLFKELTEFQGMRSGLKLMLYLPYHLKKKMYNP